MTTPYVEQSQLAQLVLDVSIGAFMVGELRQSLRVRRGARRADLRAELVFRALFFAGILMMPLGRAAAGGAAIGGGPWVFAIGTVVGWLGLGLRWWSFHSLGRYFTVVVATSDDQPVIDRGPYRVLRHPSYTGLLLAFLGGGLMVGNWFGAGAGLGLVLCGLLHRVRVEERALNLALGDRYRTFAADRARLVPYLW